MVFWIIVGVVFWLLFCLCCARYEQTLQNALKNWREELPQALERVFNRYVESVCATVSAHPAPAYLIDRQGTRQPVDTRFMEEVEQVWGYCADPSISTAHRTALAVQLCQPHQTETEITQIEPAKSLKKGILQYVLQRMAPGNFRYAIKSAFRTFWQNLRRGHMSNLVYDLLDACAREEAFRRWCKSAAGRQLQLQLQ